MTKPETVADVLAEMRATNAALESEIYDWADRIERAMAASAVPVARIAEVHMGRYTIEWTGVPLPEGALLYGYAPPVCWQHRPGSPCPWPASCRSNGCSAVERELYPEDATTPAPPPASVPDARPIDEWHEDYSYCVWWTWRDGEWLGEPSYIGSPLCDDWPGYHTHFTPHPDFPKAVTTPEPRT